MIGLPNKKDTTAAAGGCSGLLNKNNTTQLRREAAPGRGLLLNKNIGGEMLQQASVNKINVPV